MTDLWTTLRPQLEHLAPTLPREALALADTIQASARGNLMAELLRIEVAQARKDAAAEARAKKAFLANYDAQIAQKRPEYEEHRAMLDDLRKQLSSQ